MRPNPTSDWQRDDATACDNRNETVATTKIRIKSLGMLWELVWAVGAWDK